MSVFTLTPTIVHSPQMPYGVTVVTKDGGSQPTQGKEKDREQPM